MRILSWNINGLRKRLDSLQDLFNEKSPDVLMLQESKVMDSCFPKDFFQKNSYHVIFWGEKRYNGVVLASKLPFLDHGRIPLLDDQARGIWGRTKQGIFLSLYAPNPMGPHKKRWFEALKAFLHPFLHEFCVAGGDFNVHQDPMPEALALCSLEERRLMWSLMYEGWTHTQWKEPKLCWTWRDYRPSRENLCLDYLLLSPQALERIIAQKIEHNWRWKPQPSDHVPIWVDVQNPIPQQKVSKE